MRHKRIRRVFVIPERRLRRIFSGTSIRNDPVSARQYFMLRRARDDKGAHRFVARTAHRMTPLGSGYFFASAASGRFCASSSGTP